MLNAKKAIIERLIELSDEPINTSQLEEVFDFLDGIEITEDELEFFVKGRYAYETNPLRGEPLSDAWDIFDDIISNGM